MKTIQEIRGSGIRLQRGIKYTHTLSLSLSLSLSIFLSVSNKNFFYFSLPSSYFMFLTILLCVFDCVCVRVCVCVCVCARASERERGCVSVFSFISVGALYPFVFNKQDRFEPSFKFTGQECYPSQTSSTGRLFYSKKNKKNSISWE